MSPPDHVTREKKLLVPAGIASILGGILIGYSFFRIQSLVSSDTDVGRLLGYGEHSGDVMSAAVMGAAGYLLLILPLYLLFTAAQARSGAVSRAILGFVVLGPLLAGVGSVLTNSALTDVGEKFASEVPAVEREAAAEAKQDEQPAAKQDEQPAAKQDEQPAEADEDTPTGDEEGSVRDDFAEEVVSDSGLLKVGSGLILGGLFSLVLIVFYSSRAAMRTGLLTRFLGTLGMALGIASILLPPALPIWFLALGLFLLVPGGFPPAWETGESRPWPSRADMVADLEKERSRDAELAEAGLPPEADSAQPEADAAQPDPDDPYSEATGEDPKPPRNR